MMPSARFALLVFGDLRKRVPFLLTHTQIDSMILFMSSKKIPKPVKVPRYLVSTGSKNTRVIFTDGSEGFIPSVVKGSDGKGSLGLRKLDKKELERFRTTFVKLQTDSIEDEFGSGIYQP